MARLTRRFYGGIASGRAGSRRCHQAGDASRRERRRTASAGDGDLRAEGVDGQAAVVAFGNERAVTQSGRSNDKT
jgi:hypothetical protein